MTENAIRPNGNLPSVVLTTKSGDIFVSACNTATFSRVMIESLLSSHRRPLVSAAKTRKRKQKTVEMQV